MALSLPAWRPSTLARWLSPTNERLFFARPRGRRFRGEQLRLAGRKPMIASVIQPPIYSIRLACWRRQVSGPGRAGHRQSA
jgi:hypothetical protein